MPHSRTSVEACLMVCVNCRRCDLCVLVIDTPLAHLPAAEPTQETEVCIRDKEGNGKGTGEALCHDIYNLLGLITTVSLTANIHCMTDGLTPDLSVTVVRSQAWRTATLPIAPPGQALLSPTVKESKQSVNICQSYE